jgi:hypothetical protein
MKMLDGKEIGIATPLQAPPTETHITISSSVPQKPNSAVNWETWWNSQFFREKGKHTVGSRDFHRNRLYLG